MFHPVHQPQTDDHSLYPPEYREFADKLLAAMTHASRVEDDRRKHGQICKILGCLDRSEPVVVYAFWCKEAKTLASEWEDLRTATLQARADRAAYLQRLEDEDRARQAASESAPDNAPTETPDDAPEANQDAAKPARKYRKLTYLPGQNPFREGSKNAKIWDCLVEGGHTKEAIATASGADLKSVGYIIWLAGHNGIRIDKDKETKTFRLVPPVEAACSGP